MNSTTPITECPILKQDGTALRCRPDTRAKPAVTAPPRVQYTALNSYQLLRREILSRRSGGEEAVR